MDPSNDAFNNLLSTAKLCLENFSIVKGLFDGKPEPQEINSIQLQLNEVISKVIQVQVDHMALLQQNAKLEQSLKEKNQWDNERQRYRLHVSGVGGAFYILMQEKANDDPIHAICPDCLEEGRKSILTVGTDNLDCYKCRKLVNIEDSEKNDLGLSSTTLPRRGRGIGARVVG